MDSNDVKRIRSETGLSIANFCRSMKIPRKTYEKWESGNAGMTAAAKTAFLATVYLIETGLIDDFHRWAKNKTGRK